MRLEDQVCSLELAKRLKELGVKQDSTWQWLHGSATNYCVGLFPFGTQTVICSAFTVAELGVMLTGSFAAPVMNGKIDQSSEIMFSCEVAYYIKPNKCIVSLTEAHGDMVFRREVADNEADARAKMLIHLIENKLVKP